MIARRVLPLTHTQPGSGGPRTSRVLDDGRGPQPQWAFASWPPSMHFPPETPNQIAAPASQPSAGRPAHALAGEVTTARPATTATTEASWRLRCGAHAPGCGFASCSSHTAHSGGRSDQADKEMWIRSGIGTARRLGFDFGPFRPRREMQPALQLKHDGDGAYDLRRTHHL